MPVVAVFEGLEQEKYEEVIRRLTGKEQAESPADWPVEGLLAHVAGLGRHGFRVVDVWESEQAFRRFGDVLAPLLAEVGVRGAPEIYRTHTFVSA